MGFHDGAYHILHQIMIAYSFLPNLKLVFQCLELTVFGQRGSKAMDGRENDEKGAKQSGDEEHGKSAEAGAEEK